MNSLAKAIAGYTHELAQMDAHRKEHPDAPTLGQHTHQVLHELLGLSKEQLTLLDQQGVTGTQARPKA